MSEAEAKSQKPRFMGKLEKTPLIRIMSHIALEGSAGALSVANDKQQVISIFFGAGAVIFVATNKPETRIGTLLVKAGYLTHDQLERALLAYKKANMTLVQYFMTQDAIPQHAIIKELTGQARERLMLAASWELGSYAFYDEVSPPPGMIPLNMERYAILKDVAMSAYKGERALKVLSEWGNYLVAPNKAATISLGNDLKLTAAEISPLSEWINAKRPLRELTAQNPLLPPLILLLVSTTNCQLVPFNEPQPQAPELGMPVVGGGAPAPTTPAPSAAPPVQAPTETQRALSAEDIAAAIAMKLKEGMAGGRGRPGEVKTEVAKTVEPWPKEVPKVGALDEIPLPELFLIIYKSQSTGILSAWDTKNKKSVHFFKGIPFDDEALEVFIKPSTKDASIATIFDIREGKYEFKDGLPDDKRPIRNLNVGQLIYKSAAMKVDSVMISKRMAHLPQFPIKNPTPLFPRQQVKIGFKETKLLDECIDGSRSLDDVLKISPVLRAQAKKTIYGLWLVGFINFRGEAKADKLSEHHIAHLEEFLNKIKASNPFDVLGVHWSAYQEAIEEAYQKRRARFVEGGSDYYASEPESVKIAGQIVELIDIAYEKVKTRELRTQLRSKLFEQKMMERTSELILDKATIALEFREDFREGLGLFKSLVEVFPNKGIHWVGLGICLLHLGKGTDGRRAIDRGVGMAPNDPIIKKLIGKFVK